jgi:hypothetical protein
VVNFIILSHTKSLSIDYIIWRHVSLIDQPQQLDLRAAMTKIIKKYTLEAIILGLLLSVSVWLIV